MVGITELGDMKFTYSGRKEKKNKQGLGIMMSRVAAKSCFGWECINDRILVAQFTTKECKVLVEYAPVEPTDGD